MLHNLEHTALRVVLWRVSAPRGVMIFVGSTVAGGQGGEGFLSGRILGGFNI